MDAKTLDPKSLEVLERLVANPRTPQVFRMLERLNAGQKKIYAGAKVSTGGSAVLTSNLLYQGGGIFDVCTDDTLINASLQGVGLMSVMPFVPATEEMKHVGAITSLGGSETEVEQPADQCADPPSAGFKGAEMVYCFGRIRTKSPEYDLADSGLPWCQAQPRFRMFGDVTVGGEVVYPSGSIIDNDPEWGAVQAAVYARQILGRWIWTGNPLTNPNMFKGLQLLVNTGYVDARTGLPADGLDSDVKDFGNECVNDPNATKNIYEYISAVVERIKMRSMGAGLGMPQPSDMAIVAPSWLLSCLYDYWACMSGPCNVSAQGARIDQMAAREAAEAYRAGSYLPVNGWNIPTIADDFQPFTPLADGWSADIYILTFQVGGMPVLFGEYQDFNATSFSVLRSLGIDPSSMTFSVSDGGRFLLWQERKNTCFDVRMVMKPRIVCLAPFLQGRIANVCCQPLQAPQSPVPWDYPWHPDGGVSTGWHYPLVDACD